MTQLSWPDIFTDASELDFGERRGQVLFCYMHLCGADAFLAPRVEMSLGLHGKRFRGRCGKTIYDSPHRRKRLLKDTGQARVASI